jgi:hypothetical protein
MDIPKWSLKATDKINNKSQKVEIPAANHQTIVHEASEQMESPPSSQRCHLKSRPG